MRIIKRLTLDCYIDKYPESKRSLLDWYKWVREAKWSNSNELKAQYGGASLLGGERVIFNISGNEYRLIVDCVYKKKIVYITWFGTHSEYDEIDAKTVSFQDPC